VREDLVVRQGRRRTSFAVWPSYVKQLRKIYGTNVLVVYPECTSRNVNAKLIVNACSHSPFEERLRQTVGLDSTVLSGRVRQDDFLRQRY
jgi:hypothetical protein